MVLLLLYVPRTYEIEWIGRRLTNLVIPYAPGESIWIDLVMDSTMVLPPAHSVKSGRQVGPRVLDQTTTVKWTPEELHDIEQSKSKLVTRWMILHNRDADKISRQLIGEVVDKNGRVLDHVKSLKEGCGSKVQRREFAAWCRKPCRGIANGAASSSTCGFNQFHFLAVFNF